MVLPSRLLNTEAQLIPRSQTGSEDEMGIPEIIPGDPIDILCRLEPLGADEILARGGAGRATLRAFTNYSGPPRSFDELVLATGQSFEIEGPPLQWTNPRTSRSYLEIYLLSYEGPAE